MNSSEQRLPAEAIPTDRQYPLRPFSRSQSSHAISGADSHNSLNDSPRNISNPSEIEQRPLLEPQSSEFMPPIDQGNLRVFPTRLSHKAGSDSSVDTSRENFFTSLLLVLLLHLKATRRNLLVQICQTLMIFERDYHVGIIMRKSLKTENRLKCAVFRLMPHLLHRKS